MVTNEKSDNKVVLFCFIILWHFFCFLFKKQDKTLYNEQNSISNQPSSQDDKVWKFVSIILFSLDISALYIWDSVYNPDSAFNIYVFFKKKV